MLTSNTTLATNDFSSFQDGVRSQEKENHATRLANRRAFMEFSKEASAQGRVMGMEEWAGLSKDVLGPTAFLNVTNPSAQAMGMMRDNQAAAANQTAEVRRREQFRADADEEKAAAAHAQEQFLSGAGDVDVYDSLSSQFRPEVVAKLKPQLSRIQQQGTLKASQEGLEYGKSYFQTLDEAQAWVKENPHVSKYMADGILKGAQVNQSSMESSLAKEAIAKGGNGFVGDATDEASFRSVIRTLSPNLTKEQEEMYLKRAMTMAQSAAQSKLAADQDKFTSANQLSRANAYPQELAAVANLEIGEESRRAKAASDLASGYLANVSSHDSLASQYSKKKAPTPVDLEIAAGLGTHVFKNPDEYIAAVTNRDAEAVRRLKAEATPRAVAIQQANALGTAITGRFKNVGELVSVIQEARLGAGETSIQALGKEIKLQEDISSKAVDAPVKQYNNEGRSFAAFTGYDGLDIATLDPEPSTAPFSPSTRALSGAGDSKVRQAADVNAKRLRQSFVEDAATYIRQVRGVIRENGSVGASADEMRQQEMLVARKRASNLMRGMGITNVDMENDLTAKIMEAAGATPDFEKRETPAERYTRQIRDSYPAGGMRDGTIPGAVQPSPRGGRGAPGVNAPF